jgi:hypothetical protein
VDQAKWLTCLPVKPTEFAAITPTEERLALLIKVTDLKRKKWDFYI